VKSKVRSRLAMGTVSIALVAALAACGGGDNKDENATSSTTTKSSKGAPTTTASTVLGNLGSRNAGIDRQQATVTLNELKRAGNLVTLNFTVSGAVDLGSQSMQIAQTFDDGQTNQSKQGTAFTTDGVFLVDNVNKKKFPVARDTDGLCVCSSELASTFVRQNQPVTLTATFAAPANGVDKLDVVVPRVGTFTDVPLS
jgi:hypothetical protein